MAPASPDRQERHAPGWGPLETRAVICPQQDRADPNQLLSFPRGPQPESFLIPKEPTAGPGLSLDSVWKAWHTLGLLLHLLKWHPFVNPSSSGKLSLTSLPEYCLSHTVRLCPILYSPFSLEAAALTIHPSSYPERFIRGQGPQGFHTGNHISIDLWICLH